MGTSNLQDELVAAESLMVDGQDEAAKKRLAALAEDAEEYVDANCQTTEDVQWFAFPTLFERLAYRRVEKDPRTLEDVGEPLSRLYSDLALACVRMGDAQEAIEALKQCIRWNPMDCGARLDLAELFRAQGDNQEYLALTYSVFERASDARHLARAFANFSEYFGAIGKPRTQAAALRAARRLDMGDDGKLTQMLADAKGTDHDPDEVDDSECSELLGKEGLPDGANADIAVCLLFCASDAADFGNRNLATELTIRARDLVGTDACKALLELIHADDEKDEKDEGEA